MANVLDSLAAESRGARSGKRLRMRTITAGVELSPAVELDRIESALAFLARARQTFEAEGYEVQTTRIATNPWVAGVDPRAREKLLPKLQELDRLVVSRKGILSIGAVLTENRADPELPAWAAELIRTTNTTSFSTVIASPENGAHPAAAEVAARTMIALSKAREGGVGNFRFAAAANIPAGTPFFPVAWHRGDESVAIGMEPASLIEEAFTGVTDTNEATERLKTRFEEALRPIERIAINVAQREKRTYLGIDTSSAPGKDRSIAAAIEALTHSPFGSAGTLEACAATTAALKSVQVSTCGYCGLMLPVLEDSLLAQRAGEGRYSVRDLLLYSSVCGTGLDVVPLPGDTPAESISGLLRDVAALSARLRKALSARLFIVPGKKAGDIARFDDPFLTDSVVMKLDSR